MGPNEILITGGVAALLASLVGGGLKAFGVELPILASVTRQLLLAVTGLGLLATGLLVDGRMSKTSSAPETASVRREGVAPETPAAVAVAQPEVPNIVGLPFPEARQFLLQNSWSPINSASGPLANADRLGLRAEELWNAGYSEAVSCSGTGLAPCKFRYRDRSGHVLEVVTVGEGKSVVNDVVLVDCNRRPDNEAC